MSDICTVEETLNIAINKLIGSADVQDIQKIISKFSGEQREFLTLKFIQGLSNKEISALTGKSLGTLKIMQFKVLKALKKINRIG